MKLDLLRNVATAISKDLTQAGYQSISHYWFDGQWNPLFGTTEAASPSTVLALNKSKAEPVAYHASKSKLAWFHLPELDATVSVEFSNSPKISTCLQLRKKIEDVRANAVNAFKVSHNELTGLLSRDAFREILNSAIVKEGLHNSRF